MTQRANAHSRSRRPVLLWVVMAIPAVVLVGGGLAILLYSAGKTHPDHAVKRIAEKPRSKDPPSGKKTTVANPLPKPPGTDRTPPGKLVVTVKPKRPRPPRWVPDKPAPINFNNLVELDLAPMGVYAMIKVPEGVEMDRKYGQNLKGENNFTLSITEASKDLSEIKRYFENPGGIRNHKLKKLHIDSADTLLIEAGEESPHFYCYVNVKVETTTYHCSTWLGYRTLEEAKNVIACARTLRQTEAHKKAIAAIAHARKVLGKKGVFSVGSQGNVVMLLHEADDAALAAVADVPNLTFANLSYADGITQAGWRHLARATTLEKLEVGGKNTTDASLLVLSPLVNVTEMVLNSSPVTDAGLEVLAHFPKLKTFKVHDYSRSVKIRGPGLAHLARLTNLEVLSLGELPIEDTGLSHLAGLTSLKTLNLDRTLVTDQGIASLKDLTNLQSLSLRNTAVSDDGLKHLAGLKSLAWISLSDTKVKGPGFTHLVGLEHLQSIIASRTPLDDAGMAGFAGIKVESLDLSSTNVTGSGLALLGKMRGLKKLYLAGCPINDASLAALKECKELTELDLSNTEISDEGMKTLTALGGLKKLVLTGTLVTDKGMTELKKLPWLGNIDVRSTAVTQVGVNELKRIASWAMYNKRPPEPDVKLVAPPIQLEDLKPADPAGLVRRLGGSLEEDSSTQGKIIQINLFGSKLTDADMAHLRDLKDLRVLKLSSCKNITDAGLFYLQGLTGLEELHLSYTKVQGDGLIFLKGLKKLKKLYLNGKKYTIKQLAFLSDLTSLEELSVQVDEERFDQYLQILAPLKNFKWLTLESNVSGHGLAHLQGMTGLESLDCSFVRSLTDARLKYLVGLTKLKTLSVRRTSISDHGIKALRSLTALEYLNLADCNITDLALANLAGMESLKSLDLNETKVTNAGLTHLASLKKLQTLRVARTAVTPKGAEMLRKALPGVRIDLGDR